MAKRMLIDATHPEETRVVVTSGNRLEEFDFESSTKKQVKGNIYLAKVTRVEPSLQAAFVDYGGNRHGFLAFSEIHPDYYRIPVSDRRHEVESETSNGHYGADSQDDDAVPIAAALPEQVAVPEASSADEDLTEEEWVNSAEGTHAEHSPSDAPEAAAPAEETNGAQSPDLQQAASAEEAPGEPASVPWQVIEPQAEPVALTHSDPEYTTVPDDRLPADQSQPIPPADHPQSTEASHPEADQSQATDTAPQTETHDPQEGVVAATVENTAVDPADATEVPAPEAMALRSAEESVLAIEVSEFAAETYTRNGEAYSSEPEQIDVELGEAETVETLGGDEVEEVEEDDAERRRYHPHRHYKIQEVIKRRQIMLVQVAKEERGNKGAALTTYLSLAGRYCVLMPNTNRGGGVSRKITSIADRRRLKDILEELEIPEGMGVIVRTAGAERSKAEIKRDYEYLLRLWNEIRDLTLQSTAPALIYEEGNLIKRSIRDLYARDIDDVLVEGEEGYKIAKGFMRTLMPSHAKRVQPYRDPQVGLFHRFQIESQIDAVHSPVAQLRSGGYVVINQTEALVAIDVNSGRSTRERNIEETALRTNVEAADEIARQVRLRDLAGLIVIDFIDMEEHRNQVAVERRLKEALRNDRARIQVGRISPFGLLEMSRQRLRPSLAEASTLPCPHCGGAGHIRSVESTALYVLRSVEEEGARRRSAEICIYVPTNVALYILNQKRETLAQIEARYALRITVAQDDSLIPPNYRLERVRQYGLGEAPPLPTIQAPSLPDEPEDDEDEDIETTEISVEASSEQESEEDRSRRRRRRRRRRPDDGRDPRPDSATLEPEGSTETPQQQLQEEETVGRDGDGERRNRRRGRRGRIRMPRQIEETEDTDIEHAAHRQVGEPAFGIYTGGELTSERPTAERSTDEDFSEHAAAEIAALARAESSAAEHSIGAHTVGEHAYGEGTAATEVIEVVPDAPVLETPEEGAKQERELANSAAIAPTEIGAETASLAPLVGETVEQATVKQEPVLPDAMPTAEAEQGVPYASAPERALEAAEAAALAPATDSAESVSAQASPPPPSRPNEDVLTVTEKPANPRRGWWQRLINS